MVEHDNELFKAVATQVKQLQGSDASDEAVVAVLAALTTGAVAAVPGAVHACITVVEYGEVISIAATDPVAASLDELQAKYDTGPCLKAAWDQHRVTIDDYTTEQRWPLFTEDVIAETPVRSSVSFQLHRDVTSMSAFNLHADHAHAFGPDAHTIGSVFAAQAALALHTGARQTQFDQALASRDEIGQAKGILMERFTVDANQAFEMLRKISQDNNTKVALLARRLITLDHPAKN